MTLTEFADEWLANPRLVPPVCAYEQAADTVGFTLYRDDQFQVQMWTLPPGCVVTDHSHPHTNSWLVRVGGKLRLKLNGRFIPLTEMERTTWLGLATWRHLVRANDVHGVEVGTPGGSFLTISDRIDGKSPASVHQDWYGEPLGNAHATELGLV